jgi:hypothetical protein
MPVPDTNGEEWDRLEPASALDVLVELILHGEYSGVFGRVRGKDQLELRSVALTVFEVQLVIFDVATSGLIHLDRTSSGKMGQMRRLSRPCYPPTARPLRRRLPLSCTRLPFLLVRRSIQRR